MTTNKRFSHKDEEIFDRGEHFAYAHSGFQAKKIIDELNELIKTNRELNNENKQFKRLQKENDKLKQEYNKLKHRHSLLHDVCIEAECDRDRYHKDVLSLEKENEQLKKQKEFISKARKNNKSFMQIVHYEILHEGSITLEKYNEISDFCYEQFRKEVSE